MSSMGDIADIFGEEGVDTSAAPPAEFQPLPPGWYPAMIEKAELHDTKAGDGKYLKLQLSVVGDQFAGRKVFANINLANPNPKAVEIGAREIAQLGAACGLLRLKDSTELLDKVVLVKLTVKTTQGRDPENEIKAYKSMDGATPAAPSPAAAAAPKPAPAAAKAPATAKPSPAAAGAKPKFPWER